MTHLLGTEDIPDDLAELILEKAEGIPFFIEELVQTLGEEGVLTGERGAYRLERSPSELHVPATVQGVLAARIDRLPAGEKDLLQTFAVIGKEFSLGLVRSVADQSEDELHSGLSHLQAAEFIYEQPAFPEPEYIFKHALTQEVAYQSMLVERRGVLHERTGQAIEELYRGTLDAHYGELAHHYGRTENAQKAVQYLHLAGEQALERSAYAEAMSQLSRAVELVGTLPSTRERAQQELLLQLTLGGALNVTRGYGSVEAHRAFVRARDLSEQVGDATQRFQAFYGVQRIHFARMELDRSAELAVESLRMAERTQDLARAHMAASGTSYLRGEFSEARDHSEEVIRRYDPREYRTQGILATVDPCVGALSFLSAALFDLGYPDQALTRGREAVALARELSHPFSEASALFVLGALQGRRGEAEAALRTAGTVIALASEHGFVEVTGQGTYVRAAALADQGHLEEAIGAIGAMLEALRPSGIENLSPALLLTLADAQWKAGEVEEGLESIAEAQAIVTKTGGRATESGMHRVKGELLLARSPSDQPDAEASFREALKVARQQSAKSWELRAATSLARLWQQQGRKEEARELLAPVYEWFTEGFDTRDLKEANALLEELG